MIDNILNNSMILFLVLFLLDFVVLPVFILKFDFKYKFNFLNHACQGMISIEQCKYNHKWAVCIALEQDTGGGFVSCTDIVYHPLGKEFDTYEEAKEFYDSHTIDELRSLPIIQPKIECEKCKTCPLYAKGCKEFNVYGQCLRN